MDPTPTHSDSWWIESSCSPNATSQSYKDGGHPRVGPPVPHCSSQRRRARGRLAGGTGAAPVDGGDGRVGVDGGGAVEAGGVDVKLDGGVGATRAVGLPHHVPRRHPELPRAAHHGELPRGGHDVVAADDGQRAAVVVPRGEQQVHAHHQHHARLRRHHVEPLRAPHGRRRRRRGLRQRVVDDGRVAEGHAREGVGRRGRTLDDLHRRRVAAGDHIVEEEVEMRVRRAGGEQEEGEEDSGVRSHDRIAGGFC
ncbi:hypothetical protein VPH35_021078 [Triticum aestivum]